MCGIFGMYGPGLPGPAVLLGALDSLRHRGPDDEGWLFVSTTDGRCIEASGPDSILKVRDRCTDMAGISLQEADLVLGHRRLSIIDLSDAGHQPMSWEDGEYWITYNGEVFNFRELRAELRLLGCRFRTDSDTEVVLAAYSRWGEGCVNRFIGQWAFAIYDRKKARVFCSRDRFGIKPFYYWTDGDSFAFSSAIGTLTGLPCVDRIPNRRYLADFVVNGNLDDGAETQYEGINQLLPSHNLMVDLRRRSLQTYRYYEVAFTRELGTYEHQNAIRYADDIRNLLIDAVRMSLVSDVPVGTCLSGGLDSSAVVVIMNRLLKKDERQKTFTIAYNDPAVNEKRFADAVVRHTGVEGFAVYPSGEGFWKEAGDFLSRQDGLCLTVNFYAEWCVMRLASSHVKVVLNGQGGDELFGGYLRYYSLFMADLLREVRLRELVRNFDGQGRLIHLLRGLSFLSVPAPARIAFYRIKNRDVYRIAGDLLGRDLLDQAFERMDKTARPLAERLGAEFNSDFLPQLLHYDDRNAAAFSIENRVPFLDHRLVEYAAAIPTAYKIHHGWTKWVLRLALRDLLPDAVLWRKDKQGIPAPAGKWLAAPDSPVRSLMDEKGSDNHQLLWRVWLVSRILGDFPSKVFTNPVSLC